VVIRAHHIRSYGPEVSNEAGGVHYEIRLQGHLHARWSAWFDGFTVTHDPDGTTRLRGDVVDQSALHGLLRKLADIGVPLLSVTHVEPDPDD
jgi:hypothetical protein